MIRWFAGLLAAFCLVAVARVEWLDHQAGGAISRKLSLEPNMKWELGALSQSDDQVAFALKTWGASLHGVVIILIFLSLFRQARDGPWRNGWAALAGLGMTLLVWALFRQYFAVLGM